MAAAAILKITKIAISPNGLTDLYVAVNTMDKLQFLVLIVCMYGTGGDRKKGKGRTTA